MTRKQIVSDILKGKPMPIGTITTYKEKWQIYNGTCKFT